VAGSLRLYWEIALRAFQQQLAYRTANVAGLVTNCCFGYLRAVVFLAVYQGRTLVAGYDLPDVITYMWVTQGLIMVVALWGWWDVEETIRTGDVIADLAKPFSFTGFWLARDCGRAIYFLIFRCIPIFLLGQLTFGLRWPQYPVTWLLFGFSVALGVAVSFAWRFMLNLSAFWSTDARGLGNLLNTVVTLLSGLVLPLPYFPDSIRAILLVLPFAGLMQTPADVFLERLAGPALALALGQQVLWAAVMLVAAQLLLTAAVRKVVVQGG
jgi:ABC-2 type transport system permease protein